MATSVSTLHRYFAQAVLVDLGNLGEEQRDGALELETCRAVGCGIEYAAIWSDVGLWRNQAVRARDIVAIFDVVDMLDGAA